MSSSSIRTTRLSKEISELDNCWPTHENRLDTLDAKIAGPPGSPYENGTFALRLEIPDRYPFEPPRVRFVTKIYHPNIDKSDGRICLEILKTTRQTSWKPTYNINTVLDAIKNLLAEPNPHDPLEGEIAKQLLSDSDRFLATARDWTKRFAAVESSSSVCCFLEDDSVSTKDTLRNNSEVAEELSHSSTATLTISKPENIESLLPKPSGDDHSLDRTERSPAPFSSSTVRNENALGQQKNANELRCGSADSNSIVDGDVIVSSHIPGQSSQTNSVTFGSTSLSTTTPFRGNTNSITPNRNKEPPVTASQSTTKSKRAAAAESSPSVVKPGGGSARKSVSGKSNTSKSKEKRTSSGKKTPKEAAVVDVPQTQKRARYEDLFLDDDDDQLDDTLLY